MNTTNVNNSELDSEWKKHSSLFKKIGIGRAIDLL